MKVILYVFSGTGNTLKVADLYKKYLDCDTTIYTIRQLNHKVPDPNDYDLAGFGYPIHAFNAPEPFIDFLKKLPAVDRKKCFIFKSAGEGLHINDCSSQQTIQILQRKGFVVTQERHIVMPYNMLYRHTDGMVKQMWIYAKALSDLNVRDIKEGKTDNVHQPFFKTWYAPILRIEWWWARFHGTWFRVDRNKCVDCGSCMSQCPMQNISKDEKGIYRFHHNCALCMGCCLHCPTDAIHIGIFEPWKVNGDYKIDKLAGSIKFPYLDGTEKGIYKIYRKYYHECDKRLSDANIDINDYIYE